MKILVTGAAGLIGAEVVHYLRLRGHEVMGIVRELRVNSDMVDEPLVSLDLLREDLSRILPNTYPDALVHCAAVFPAVLGGKEDKACARINQQIDNNVISFTNRTGCKTVFMSSTAVYGLASGPKHEESVSQPEGYYAEGKLRSEALFTERGKEGLVFRLNAPYGPRQRILTVLKLFIRKALAGEILEYHGTGTRTQTFTHCNDVAVAVDSALFKNDISGTFNIAGEQVISMQALAKLIVNQIKGAQDVMVKPSGQPDPQEGYRSIIEIAKARSVIGWVPRITLASGVKECIEFEMSVAGL